MPKRAENIDRWGFPLPAGTLPPRAKPVAPPVADELLPARNRKRGPRSLRRERLIARLKELAALRKPGQTFSYTEIGKFCDVSAEYIKQLETSGLKKLRKLLPADFEKQLYARD